VPVRCGTGLSGAPRCQSSNGRNHQNPNGWVTWLAHRTVRCAHRQQPSPTIELVVGAINTPQPPPLQPSKHSLLLIQYKSNRHHFKDTIQEIDPLKVSKSTLAHLDLREDHLCFLCSCLLGWLSSFLILVPKCFVSKARDTNCVVVLARSK
jgi:hypothetical protein